MSLDQRIDLLMGAISALGFDRVDNHLVHRTTGEKLSIKWSSDVLHDLVHFHGIDASEDLGLIFLEAVWRAACTISSRDDKMELIQKNVSAPRHFNTGDDGVMVDSSDGSRWRLALVGDVASGLKLETIWDPGTESFQRIVRMETE